MAENDKSVDELIKSIETSKEPDKEKSPFQFSLWLFLLGIGWFFVRDFIPFNFQPWDSVFFLFFTSFLVFKGKGAVTNVVLFGLFWYFKRINIAFVAGAAIIIVAYVVYRTIYKYEGDVQRALRDELLSLIPLAVLFLDLIVVWNLFGFRTNNVILTTLAGLPLWGLLGAVLWLIEAGTIRNQRPNKKLTWFEASMMFLAFITILFYLLGNVWGALAASGDYELVKVSDLGTTTDQLKKRTTAWKEVQYKVECSISGEAANLKGCIDKKRAEDQCKEFKQGSPEHKACMDNALGVKDDSRPRGGVDPKRREPMELKIEKADRFPSSIAQNQALDFKLMFNNPRRQKVRGKAYCEIKSAGNEIKGNVETYEFKGEIEQKEFTCEPPSEWPKGRMNVKVSFIVEGMETDMDLHRVYVGELKEENKKRDEEIKRGWASEALGPNDPVWLDFRIGDEVLIRDNPKISAYVVNRRDGTIEHASGEIILIDYPESLALVEVPSCKLIKDDNVLINSAFSIGKEGKEFQYASCKTTISEELKNPKLPVYVYYVSFIKYDYKITKEFAVTVT